MGATRAGAERIHMKSVISRVLPGRVVLTVAVILYFLSYSASAQNAANR
jgi:hypothetical protein